MIELIPIENKMYIICLLCFKFCNEFCFPATRQKNDCQGENHIEGMQPTD